MKRYLDRLKLPHYMYLVLHGVLLLVGMLLLQFEGPLIFSLGTSFVAAAITGWVVFVYVFLSQDTANRLSLLSRFGITDAFDARSIRIRHEYATRLSQATECIDVLGFGQRALREDLSSEFETWAAHAKVRILLIDPEYPTKTKPLADMRDIEENNEPHTIRKDVRAFIKACDSLLTSKPDRFAVRLYTCLPSVNIFRIDNQIFWGPYLVGGPSRNMPTLLVESGGLLFDRLKQHFDTIWTTDAFSRAIPNEWLTQNDD